MYDIVKSFYVIRELFAYTAFQCKGNFDIFDKFIAI